MNIKFTSPFSFTDGTRDYTILRKNLKYIQNLRDTYDYEKNKTLFHLEFQDEEFVEIAFYVCENLIDVRISYWDTDKQWLRKLLSPLAIENIEFLMWWDPKDK